jgi:hypothetical protein
MNKERYNQIIDEAYENYTTYMNSNWMETRWNKTWISDDGKSVNGRRYKKEEFIDKCKTDLDLSERWGLKIEERELSLEERSLIANSNHYEVSLNIKGIGVDGDVTLHTHLDELNIPTKLITLLYSNETIEVYE